MIEIKNIVRENILKITPYSCARDEFKGSDGIFLDANENPYGTLNRYPDPYQKELKKAISEKKNIDANRIFIGNGSDEIIDLCFRTFCVPGKDKAMILPPTYGMYEVSAGINDIALVKIPLNEEFQPDIPQIKKNLSDANLKLIFICSPNNPTGNSVDERDVRFLLENFNGIIVIDEAYIDFSKKQSFIKLVEKYNNLIIMQTFSKARGLAAARIGMAFTDQEIVKYFNKVKPPYNISTINQKAALARIRQEEESKEIVAALIEERERVAEQITKLGIIEKVYPSDSNFLLAKVSDATELYNYLVKRNIIIRNRNSIIRNCVRITIGRKNENDELLKAIKEYEQHKGNN
ncbi:MAG TPA: histidinol-phosphate transaminase [Bacteroidales bacterium]|nr:histidinol-phosphate transaminase [Bacteroidales bacterium]